MSQSHHPDRYSGSVISELPVLSWREYSHTGEWPLHVRAHLEVGPILEAKPLNIFPNVLAHQDGLRREALPQRCQALR